MVVISVKMIFLFFFFSSRRRHTRYWRDWSSDVCSSDLVVVFVFVAGSFAGAFSMLPGGIGAAEAGMYGLFVGVTGLSAGISAALTLVIRLATLWFATLLGVIGLFVVRRVIGEPADSALAGKTRNPRGVV